MIESYFKFGWTTVLKKSAMKKTANINGNQTQNSEENSEAPYMTKLLPRILMDIFGNPSSIGAFMMRKPLSQTRLPSVLKDGPTLQL